MLDGSIVINISLSFENEFAKNFIDGVGRFNMASTLVIGLDGANWGLIEDWLTEGRLPSIARLRDEGTHAISESEYPPVTCPNWKCYSTSKNPGELGVFWWERIDMDNQEITFPNSTSFQSAELWDYFGDAGRSWFCLNMPTTYPPRDIPNGDVVAGGPLCADEGYASDPNLERTLESEFPYRVRPEQALTSTENSSAEVEMMLSLIETRFDVLEWYIDEYEPEFAHVTIFLINILQHYFWRDDPVRQAWELIDERIGELIDDDTNVILMSDHGCSPVDTVFHVNQWLAEEGYLTTTASVSTAFDRLNITKERMSALVEALGIRTLARKAPDAVKNLFPQEGEGAKRGAKGSIIDWQDSVALASGQGPLYLSSDCPDETVEQLIEDLRALETPDGRPVASNVFRNGEVYSGQNLDIAPDIVIEQAPGIHIADGIGHQSIFTTPSRWNAENDRDGLFLAWGPDLKQTELNRISIKDIAPTILHLNGLAVPTDMEGHVLDVFHGESEIDVEGVQERAPINIGGRSAIGSEKVEERLEDLGYLGQ
jgi:predicted AlkP superfamily phosphohydrolase/phosphomutase